MLTAQSILLEREEDNEIFESTHDFNHIQRIRGLQVSLPTTETLKVILKSYSQALLNFPTFFLVKSCLNTIFPSF